MGRWSKFNKKYGMTPEDWKEWRATRNRYKDGGYIQCQKCGATIAISPLITFLIDKEKLGSILCSNCEKRVQ